MRTYYILSLVVFCFGFRLCKANQPPSIIRHPKNVTYVSTGSNATLSCNATGSPTPDIEWRKNGVKILSQFVKTYPGNETVVSYLHIINVTANDKGSYVCFANNSAGNATSKVANLTIGEIPSNPKPSSGNSATTTASPSANTTTPQGGRGGNSGGENSTTIPAGSTTITSSVEGTRSSGGSTTASPEEGTTTAGGSGSTSGGGGSLGGTTAGSSGGGSSAGGGNAGSTTPSSEGSGGGSSTEVPQPDIEAEVTAHLEGNYTSDLSVKTSEGFKKKKTEVDDAVLLVVSNDVPGARREKGGVYAFREGSILADIIIYVDPKASNLPANVTLGSAITNAIKSANASNSLGSLNLLGVTVSVTYPTHPPTTTQPPAVTVASDNDSGLKGWQVALIVIFILVLLGIVVFIAFLVFYKKNTMEAAKELEEFPDEDEDHQYAEVNENVYDNIVDEAPDVEDDAV